MKRLQSAHAEDVGGFIVEPGQEFDERDADPNTIKRLDAEGKLADAAKPKPAKKSEE